MGVEGVPFTALLKELGIPVGNSTYLKRRHLLGEDHFLVGKRVYVTPEGERKLRIYAAARDDAPQVIQAFRNAVVVRQHPNPAWVLVEVESDDGSKDVLNCAIPRKLHGRMTRGKRIRVEIVTDGNVTTARHENLAGF